MTDLAARLVSEHRKLDQLYGRFLTAAFAGDAAAATPAIEEFDRELRRHTSEEEQSLFEALPGHRLAAPAQETESQRFSRELRLEHVQVRELSGMIVRRLSEGAPLEEVRALAGSLARRWDAHTRREEEELLKNGTE